jgi:hypothetical protein
MTEADYWTSLEYRVSREFAGMGDLDLREYWCDGFTPEQYYLTDPDPRITGRAWVCFGQHPQQRWEFTLFLGQPFESREGIDWSSLLPPENVTCWVALDRTGQRLQLEPGAAVPDPAGRSQRP